MPTDKKKKKKKYGDDDIDGEVLGGGDIEDEKLTDEKDYDSNLGTLVDSSTEEPKMVEEPTVAPTPIPSAKMVDVVQGKRMTATHKNLKKERPKASKYM